MMIWILQPPTCRIWANGSGVASARLVRFAPAISRFASNSRGWQQTRGRYRSGRSGDDLCAEARHRPLLLRLKGSLNEYELDLLRQRSPSACYVKARGRVGCGGAISRTTLRMDG